MGLFKRGKFSPTRYAKNRGKTKGLRGDNWTNRAMARDGIKRSLRYGRSIKGF